MARTLTAYAPSMTAATLRLYSAAGALVQELALAEIHPGKWRGTLTAPAGTYSALLLDGEELKGAWESVTVTGTDPEDVTVRELVNTTGGSGGGGGDATLAKQEEILAAVAALKVGAGSGPNLLLVSVTDPDGEPLQGVALTVYANGVERNVLFTGAAGTAVFSLAAGEWRLLAYKAGYQHTPPAGTTLPEIFDVVAEGARPVRMTPMVVPPSTVAGTVTGRYVVRNEARQPVAGETVELRLHAPAPDEAGSLYSPAAETNISNAAGQVFFADLVPRSDIWLRVGARGWVRTTVPRDADADGMVDLLSAVS